MRSVWAWGCTALAALATLEAWAEAQHWRSSRRGFGSGSADPSAAAPNAAEAVVVLGLRNRGSRANYVNRWRVRAGIRSQRLASSRLVLCGGPTASAIPEAVLMATYARGGRRYTGRLDLETTSTSTWENIRNAIPLIEHADRITIVSNSLHAEKGRIYLRMQRPDLATRLVPAADYRFGELFLLKPVLAIIGLRNLRRLDRA